MSIMGRGVGSHLINLQDFLIVTYSCHCGGHDDNKIT